MVWWQIFFVSVDVDFDYCGAFLIVNVGIALIISASSGTKETVPVEGSGI